MESTKTKETFNLIRCRFNVDADDDRIVKV